MFITFERQRILIQREIGNQKDGLLRRESISMEVSVARIFHKVLNRARVTKIFEKTDYELLGSMLYKIFEIHDDIKDFFIGIIAEVVRDKEIRCRVILNFENDVNDLALLPWEYLLIPDIPNKNISSFYLAAAKGNQFDLVRYIKSDNPIKVPDNIKEQENIKVVLLTVNAQEKDVDVEELKTTFNRIRHNSETEDPDGNGPLYKFNSFHVSNLKRKDLTRRSNNTIENIEGPFVLHFFGHAEMQDNGPHIGLYGEDGKIDWVNSKDFVEMINTMEKKPVLIVMQACESGLVDENGRSIGAELAMMGIPVTVAMQNEVTSDVSMAFIEEFYRLLIEGKSVAQAVTSSRYFLGCKYKKDITKIDEQYNNNTFGTAVVFVSNVSEPLYLLPQLKKEVTTISKKDKICTVCSYRFRNTALKICNVNFCSGELREDDPAENREKPFERPLGRNVRRDRPPLSPKPENRADDTYGQ